MQISETELEFAPSDWPTEPGYHDVTWLNVTDAGVIFPVEHTSWGITRFLAEVAKMAGDNHEFKFGTVYCNVVANDEATPSGRFHYDTGADHPIEGHEVTRFVLAWSSDYYPVGTVYTRNPANVGLTVDSVWGSGVIQPPNGRLVRHEEGTDLHGLLSSPARPGSVTVFVSATLYRATQTPDLHCPALRPLRTDNRPDDPAFMKTRGLS